jgi:hypothetical protein
LRSDYQALIKLWLPVYENLPGFAEWRYYGCGEAFCFTRESERIS